MSQWWNSITDALRGTLLLFVALIFFSVMLILIRIAGQAMPVAQILVARQVVLQIVILALAGGDVALILRTNNLRLQLIRAFFSFGATTTTFIAIIFLPLALATAISFTYALFVTLGAAIILGEKVGPKRWAAMLVGFVGVFIMLGPSEGGDLFYIGLAILGAVFSAGMLLSVRGLGEERVGTVLTYQGILVLPLLIVPLVLTWQTPTLEGWLLLLGIGLTGTVGQYLLIIAYQRTDASILAPLDFVRLVLMTACGLLLFDEHLSPTLAIGMVLVTLTTIYTVRANAAPAMAPPMQDQGRMQ